MSILKRINVNVGILGHVDSGKTTLAKALSSIGSTAAFDSNPQSQERGITIDLGFSSFPMSDKWNFTLVDCPGHASLIKTVIGGLQIMDIMILCVDISKGLQAQGKECLTIAQLTCEHLIVVVTKLDLIEPSKREIKITKTKAMVNLGLAKTKFASCPVIFVSANETSIGVGDLKVALLEKVEAIKFVRDYQSPFVMAIDHCFVINGKGTVLTGTVLQGKVKINDSVEVPSQKIVKKVKSIQSFRIPMSEAGGGDRVGICVPGIDATKLERGVVAAPGYVRTGVTAGVATIDKVSYFKNSIRSAQSYQVAIGYESVETKIILFRSTTHTTFDTTDEFEYVDSIGETLVGETPVTKVECDKEDTTDNFQYFAILQFKIPTMVVPNPFIIGADLASGGSTMCRIAFSGHLIDFTEDKQPKLSYLPKIKIFRNKVKIGQLERIRNASEVLVVGFCKKESAIQYLVGLKVLLIEEFGTERIEYFGKIDGRFGQTTKLLVRLDVNISEDALNRLNSQPSSVRVYLKYKKYLFSTKDTVKLVQ